MANAVLDLIDDEAGSDSIGEATFGADPKRDKQRYCYFKKAELQPNGEPSPDAGYIVTASAVNNQLLALEEKGMVPLRRYGYFRDTTPSEGWSIRQDQYKRILLNGGAKEFPVKQLVEFGWHKPKNLPRYARKVKFPQLAGVKVLEAECPSCHKVFASLDDAVGMLAKHEQIAHKESNQQQAIARALADAQESASGPMKEIVGAIQGQMAAQGATAQQTAEALALLAQAVGELAKQSRKT